MNPWQWDTHRQQYYFVSEETAEYVFQAGERVRFRRHAEAEYIVVNSRVTCTSSGATDTDNTESTLSSGHSVPTNTDDTVLPSFRAHSPHSRLDELASCVEGRYQVIRTINRGGQTLHKGVREVLDLYGNGTIYALKTYVCDNLEEFEDRWATFNREIQIMLRLNNSPYVVRLIRYHANPFTMEYSLVMSPVANQGNLFDYLLSQFQSPNSRTISDDFVHTAMWDLANGLQHIHRLSVRHRDVKSGNILVHNHRLLYTDFGLSLDFYGQADTETNNSHPENYCTSAYAAPEIFAHAPRSKKSDIFSLGCVFLEILVAHAVGCTADVDWGNNTIFGNYFTSYSQMVTEGRVASVLDWVVYNQDLFGVHVHVRRIREMLDPAPGNRPEAESIMV